MEQEIVNTVAAKKKKGGCLKGCLLFFLALILLVGAAACYVLRVPQRLGLIKGPGARLLASVPERVTAEEIVTEAAAKGFNATGVTVFVFPKPSSDEATLFASYDFSKKATLPQSGPYHPVVQALVLLGGGEKAKEYQITHVGAEFRDEEGKLLIAVAASTTDIHDLQAGKITEEEFRQRMGKQVDLQNYINRAVIPL